MSRIASHARALWPRFTALPAIPFTLWALFWAARGELRWDHVAMAMLVIALAYGSARTKRVFVALLPFGLVGLFYDAMRFVKNVGLDESSVHVCDLRDAELRLFGITSSGARMTLHDWFRAHPSLLLDALCAVPYGTFLIVIVAYALFLFWYDFPAVKRFGWAFLTLNMLGFATYHVYPAAPPWYYHLHGCAVDLNAAASEGPSLARVDALLGFRYFGGFYGRASDVFGAVPSLHVAYPLLMLIEGWAKHGRLGRGLLAGFYAWMCFSAVYLDHHWVIDIILGSAYASLVAVALRRLMKAPIGADYIADPVLVPVAVAAPMQGGALRRRGGGR